MLRRGILRGCWPLLGAFALASFVGCGSDEAAAPLTPAEDPTEAMFDPDRVLEVVISMDPADWDELRQQTREIEQLLVGDCMAEPVPKIFTYFPATVTVDGQVRDNVGVRKKGLIGSLSTEKPSLKVKFHEYVAGQKLNGLRRMTLNNARQDPSYVKQCMGYQLFADAGIAASRCNYAQVTLNGQDLGLYVHVEGVKKDFLARHFSDPGGNLYEITISDFRPGWTDTFERKTNKSDPDRSDLEGPTAALQMPDAELVAALGPVVDLDAFFNFWATEVLVGHWDGYAGNTNNSFVYRDPATNRFAFIPWGIDACFDAYSPFVPTAPPSVLATGMLARRLYLYPETRDRYVAELVRLLDEIWDEQAILAEIDRMQQLLLPYADPQGDGDFAGYVDVVRGFVHSRRAHIEADLEGGPPSWDEPLREPPCFVEMGAAEVSFSTTWGPIEGRDAFVAGSGAIDATWEGQSISFSQVGSLAGPGDGTEGIVAVVAITESSELVIVYVTADQSLFAAGSAIPIDWKSARGTVLYAEQVTDEPAPLGFVGSGTLQLDQASTADGSAVAGSFEGTLVVAPWE